MFEQTVQAPHTFQLNIHWFHLALCSYHGINIWVKFILFPSPIIIMAEYTGKFFANQKTVYLK